MAFVRAFLVIGVLCLVLYRYVIYPAFRSPLSRIPKAHFSASLSPLWMLWIRYRCREVRTIHASHEKLGPVVRLGPNELSVNCIDGGVRTIYNGNFEKHAFYPNLFTASSGEVQKQPHARRRRLISNIYSKSTLQNSPTMAAISSSLIRERLMPKIQAAVDGDGEVEMFHLIVAVTMDFITAYQFGLRNGSDFIRKTSGAQWWIEHFDNIKEGSFWPQELPGLAKALSTLGMEMTSRTAGDSASELDAWCLEMMKSADLNEEQATDSILPEDVPVHYDRLKAGFAHETDWAAERKIAGQHDEPWRILAAAELFDNIGGAQEGTTIAIFYVLRQLARNPDLQTTLRNQLADLSPPTAFTLAGTDMPDPKDIDGLPLLDAVLMETLRLFPPMAGPQPRVTPPNATIGPYHGLPAGVRVSSQPYSLHRNPSVFPAPESWKPERWIDSPAAQKAEMMNWYWGFSSGSMMCIGSHFAIQQIKLVTAALVSNFSFSVVNDQDTDPIDAYSALPVSRRLVLKFERLP